MAKKDIKNYDFFINKALFNLIALFGFLIIFLTGMYYGYTLKENSEYLQAKETKFINNINNKYTYNFIPNENKKYGDEISSRITNVILLFITIGIFLLLYGIKKSYKYEYNNKSFKEKLKILIKKLKKVKV
jgi:hypothetical protein